MSITTTAAFVTDRAPALSKVSQWTIRHQVVQKTPATSLVLNCIDCLPHAGTGPPLPCQPMATKSLPQPAMTSTTSVLTAVRSQCVEGQGEVALFSIVHSS